MSELLGRAPADWGRFEQVRGTIRKDDTQWLLTIEVHERGERLTRLITSPSCDDLAQAAAIAIALALEGNAPGAQGVTAAAPEPSSI